MTDMDVHALFLVVLLHALILFSATSAIAAALDNSTDLASSLAFKAASTTTSGGDASENIIAANRTTDAPFCTWFASVAAAVGRGSSPSISLQGIISPHLSFLSSLDLSNNSLSGAIPDTLGQLRQLATLRLSQNLLSGPIPPSLFNMSSLINIYLTSNNLFGSLPTLVMLPRIEYISVMDN
ncbi:putative receptor-like protein kinase [Iris pallida]|uniref:Receptor-like protein kinase n=1 Tax=Iris pallida TaxID=29817 RepID=A0AAX6II48_IRIPA|nr:putative receptor-like protein kinase [Iris pallida]